MSHIEKVKEGQKARWPYDKSLPDDEAYKDPELNDYVFVGWKFNDQEPFYPNPNNESENPFGPINNDTEIKGILDRPDEIIIEVEPNISTIGADGRIIDITYYLRTNHDYKVNRSLNFQFVDIDQSWYEEGNVYFVNSTVRRTITILPNNSDEQRVFTFKVTLGNLENEIALTQNTREESEECDAIIENSTGETTLAIKLFGVDTNKNVFIGYTSSTGVYDIYYNCGATFVGILVKNNTGGLIAQNSRISIIDDYAIMPKLPSYYGNFNQMNFDSDYLISTVKDSEITNTINYHGIVDEDNLILLRGSVTNKAIRVPCNGFSATISMSQYPYDYVSDFFNTDPKMIFMSLINNNFSSHNISQSSFTYNGFEGSLRNWSNSAIDYDFTYSIEPNETCDYKLFAVYFTNHQSTGIITPQIGTKQTDNSCVMLQFIQEYDVKNRIYYGFYGGNESTNKYPPDFDDKYNETHLDAYKYNFWFETCSSKALTENSFSVTLNGSVYIIAYPNVGFDYQITYDGNVSGPEPRETNYIWGNKSYTLIQTQGIQNITFTKR